MTPHDAHAAHAANAKALMTLLIVCASIAFVSALYALQTKPLSATLPCPLWTDTRCVSVVGGGGSGGGLLVVHTGAALGCGYVNVQVLP